MQANEFARPADGRGLLSRKPARSNASGLVLLEPLLQRVVCQELLHRGFTTAVGTDPADALQELAREAYDFVLTDLVLADGTAAAAFAQKLRFNRDAASRRAWIAVVVHSLEDVNLALLRNAGISSVILGEVTLGSVGEQLERMRKDRRVFIDAPGYVGPDRRCKTKAWPDRANRRGHRRAAAAQPAAVTLTEVPLLPAASNG